MNSGDKKYLWQQDRLIKAGLAHLWFVAIHPLEDGNGRIACASGGMVLARAEESVQRFYSLSTQIQRERKEARKSPKGMSIIVERDQSKS